MNEMVLLSCHDRDLRVCLECLRDYLGDCADGGIDQAQRDQGWGRFVATCSALVSGRSRRCRLQPADGKDVLQELWVEVLGKHPKARSHGKPGAVAAWLLRVLFSKALNVHRRRARHLTQALGKLLGTGKEPTAGSAVPEARIERQEEARQLHAALRGLGDSGDRLNALILVLRYLEGFKPAEIAEIVCLTPDQVRERLRRTIAKLRTKQASDSSPDA
jgi:RNA polymerase sigma factor (sigma-70 family)